MTYREWLSRATQKLKDAKIDSAQLDAIILLEHVLKLERTKIIAYDNSKLSPNQLNKLRVLLNKRLSRIPVAYLIYQKEFYGYTFFINEKVLVPRPETETIVEEALKLIENRETRNVKRTSLLDLATGSGCIAIALKLQQPSASVSASDISADALEVAKNNAKKLNANIKFIKSNLFTNIEQKYDLITANLPYVPDRQAISPETDYEPSQALCSGKDGLSHIKRFLINLPSYLNRDGHSLIEHLPTQKQAIENLCQKNQLKFEPVNKFVSKVSLFE